MHERICAPVPDTAVKHTDFSLDDNKPLTTIQMTANGKLVVMLALDSQKFKKSLNLRFQSC